MREYIRGVRRLRPVWALTAIICLTMLLQTSCVHEWPDPLETREVTLTVHHELPWAYRDFNTGIGLDTRSEEEDLVVRYIYRVYPSGTTEIPVSEHIEYRSDLGLSDFTTVLDVPSGDYDIWVWSDYVRKDSSTGLYYNAGIFRSVTYTSPYHGETMRKDAFSGKAYVSVPSSIDGEVTVTGDLTLRRPLTGYVFVSSDLSEFVKGEIARRKLSSPEESTPEASFPDLDFTGYRVKVSYTGYLPSEYDIFKGKPVDSATGVTYEAEIRALSPTEASVGFDLFFINGTESSVRVAVDIYAPDGERIAGTQNIDIPVSLSTLTIVRGNFLTTKASGGVGISPDFEGEFNIQI